MRIVFFCHSLTSCWNNGNAHFLRGLASELAALGHRVDVYEASGSGSGPSAVDAFHAAYRSLRVRRYDSASLDLDAALDRADLVLVHEWNAPALVNRIARHRERSTYLAFFHDTGHRAVSAPEQLAALDLGRYDGVLAFGAVLRDLYLRRGWAQRAWTFHEAADTRVFRPIDGAPREGDLVWIGNWGDDERDRELHELLLEPAGELRLRARVHGAGYPAHARDSLARHGVEYAGWLPNLEVPRVFAAFAVTVHVPRRPYALALPGIPTIRPFEALACGIPLVCGPWDDEEGLFRPGVDYLVARDGAQMRRALREVLADPALAWELASHGRRTILERHTCAHRAAELLAIAAEVRRPGETATHSGPGGAK